MLGSISRLWRYPVKSMLGEQLESLDMGPGGIAGDRRFAIRNADGRLASGKNSRRFFKLDGLLRFAARYEGDAPVVVFPDGNVLRGDHPDIDNALSAAFGQPVTLATESDLRHLDAEPVHLLSTSSLDWLRNAVPGLQLNERRFRPNIVTCTEGTSPVEQDWIGKTLAIGEEVILRVNHPTERCVMVTQAQAGLPDDTRVLSHLTWQAHAKLGVYAQVIRSGRIKQGDVVTEIPQTSMP